MLPVTAFRLFKYLSVYQAAQTTNTTHQCEHNFLAGFGRLITGGQTPQDLKNVKINLPDLRGVKRQASEVLASQYWRPKNGGRPIKLKLKFYYANRPCRFQKCLQICSKCPNKNFLLVKFIDFFIEKKFSNFTNKTFLFEELY